MLVFLISTNRKRQNTILVKVPAPDESQEEQESGSETSDSVCNGGQSLNSSNGQNVTLITLNAEGTVLFNCEKNTENNSFCVTEFTLFVNVFLSFGLN